MLNQGVLLGIYMLNVTDLWVIGFILLIVPCGGGGCISKCTFKDKYYWLN